MKPGQPEIFETTLQKTNVWLKQIDDLLHWDDHHKAYHGLRAVLHALRDRLPVAEAAHLGAQLPLLVRGIYYEGWKPAAKPRKFKTAQEFYDAVREYFSADRNVNPIRLTEAVMTVLSANISAGELQKLQGIFPPKLGAALGKERTVRLARNPRPKNGRAAPGKAENSRKQPAMFWA
jgi:uncharacterized protein (DUF2267 family)